MADDDGLARGGDHGASHERKGLGANLTADEWERWDEIAEDSGGVNVADSRLVLIAVA